MDVKTAFLNGDLEEEIYIDQPERFIVKRQETKVCKLVKSLYSFKQAPKQWHHKFNKVIAHFGFSIHQYDKCIYSNKLDNDYYIILCLYVDDIHIFGTSFDAIQRVKDYLPQNFDTNDLGHADMILGIKMSRTLNRISVSLARSIERMLHKFDFYNTKLILHPMILQLL